MIKTFKTSNGSTAALGKLQMQPVVDDLSYSIKQQATVAPNSSAPGTALLAYQAAIDTPTIRHSSDEFEVSRNLSLFEIVQMMISDKDFLLPPYHSKTNHILPSFASNLVPSPSSRAFNKTNIQVAAKKLEPYEQLTGISHERPEIVMFTNFLPLFINDMNQSQPSFINQIENGGISPFMTDAGKFIDTVLQSKQLRHVDIIELMRDLETNYPYVKKIFHKHQLNFSKDIESLRDNANFLLQLIYRLQQLKTQLDLRGDDIIINYENTISSLSTSSNSALYWYNKKYRNFLPATETISEVLIKIGYSPTSVKQKFTSTKIWMQLILEMKQHLQFHSLELLDTDRSHKQRDVSPTKITKSYNNDYFSINKTLPILPSLSFLTGKGVYNVSEIINTLIRCYQALYQNVNFKSDEAQIAAMANLISKEFRYSYGLSDQGVVRALSDQFNYEVIKGDNNKMFDSIVGNIGENILDVPPTQSNSLANVSQYKPATNIGVLTFESKYIDGDSGTFTPGGTYYVDQTLKTDGQKFDTSHLNEATNLFERTYKFFNVVVNGLNMLGLRSFDYSDKTHGQFTSILSSSEDFIRDLLKVLVDENTGITLPDAIKDNLGAVYSRGAYDIQVKAVLFMLTMARVTRSFYIEKPFFLDGRSSNDNTSLVDYLIEKIISTLENTTYQTVTGNKYVIDLLQRQKQVFPVLTKDTIRASLKSGTPLTNFIETKMQQVLTAFREENHAMIDDHTRFGGHLDTTIMMVVFDMILKMIERYNSQTIVSNNHGLTKYSQGILSYNIARTTTSYQASLNDLYTKVKTETALTYRLLFSVTNILKSLSGAFENCSSYLNSPIAIDNIKKIAKIVDDPNVLNMLVTHQQTTLLASTITDIIDKISTTKSSNNSDVDGTDNTDISVNFRSLDDSTISPTLRNAVYGVFGDDSFASNKGINKKILTVGIPLGFTQRLKQRVKVNNLKNSTFDNKQSDIVQVVVYKVDQLNSDIVYRPQKFLFEMSRFTVRNENDYLDISERATIDDVVKAIPTRDFGNKTTSSDVTYWGASAPNNAKISFSDESYSFLQPHEKALILRNHVMSYVLETYIKAMTGVSLADYHFNLIQPSRSINNELIQLITEHYVSLSANRFKTQKSSNSESSGGVLFSSTVNQQNGSLLQQSNTAGIPGNNSPETQFQSAKNSVSDKKNLEVQQSSIGSLETNLSSISHSNVPVLLHGIRMISGMSHMLTTLSDFEVTSKRLLTPKQFDRVFNVIVDPDDFEIDYDRTIQTPHGVQALKQMIMNGDINPVSTNKVITFLANLDLQSVPSGRPFVRGYFSENSINIFKFRDRDKNQGDLTFEKYFVTIETYGEDQV